MRSFGCFAIAGVIAASLEAFSIQGIQAAEEKASQSSGKFF